MDLQTYISNAVKVQRQNRFSQSEQLSLGELILKLEPIAAKQSEVIEKYKSEADVVYDFEYLYPTRFDSWRGSYDELALNFETNRYESKRLTVSEFLNLCKETIGKTFTGYKGGEYTMGKSTPVWVANNGNAGNTAIVNVVDNEYEVILITELCEF